MREKEELTLLQRPEVNSVSACFILSQWDLPTFIQLSKEERRRMFGGVCGESRIVSLEVPECLRMTRLSVLWITGLPLFVVLFHYFLFAGSTIG